MKKMLKAWLSLFLAASLAVSLAGCTIPVPGFADYDVSAYIQALLDSSYHDSNEDLMELAKITEEKARANNTTTVENAVVNFCNTYELSPSEAQLQELQKVMKQAFALTKYMVKDERKTDTGYYLEVEIASITNFEGRQADIEKLKTAAQQEATAANTAKPSVLPGTGNTNTEDDSYGDSDEEEETSSLPEPDQEESGGEKVDANELFLNKVLDFCKQELANISYDPEMRTIALDIRQTEKGELQLDLNQIEKIDQTVLRFTR